MSQANTARPHSRGTTLAVINIAVIYAARAWGSTIRTVDDRSAQGYALRYRWGTW